MASRTVKIDRDVGEIISVALAEAREKLPVWAQPYSLAVERIEDIRETTEGSHKVVTAFVVLRRKVASAMMPDVA